MHPLRKRKVRPDGTCSQYGTEEDEGSTSEPRNKAGPANRIDEKEEQSIVISDSDSLELEEEGKSQKKVALHRKTLSVKRKIARMTEEEQLALAVKISQQEQANHVKHRQEEEEALLRKAIEESLHSCTSPSRSPTVTVHDLSKEASSGEEDMALDEQDKEHLSQQSQILGQDSPQNPKVLLKRLSQDIVESSSVILSPNCKDPLPCTESCKASSLSPSINDFAYMSPSTAPLSPVFPVKSPYARKMLPCRLFQDRSTSAATLPIETESPALHCSESTQLDSSSLISASNKSELTEDASSLHSASVCLQGSGIGNTSVNNKDDFSKHACSSKKQHNDSSVHYYWGIPFCPNGEDPNAYTQVILCQLEVYEKSLKKSQLQLLKKTEYGEPIDLAASSESGDHAKDNQGSLSQEDTEEIMEGGDQQKPQQSEMETSEETDSSDIQPGPSKRSKASCSHFQEDDHSCQSERQVKSQSHEQCTELLPSECKGLAPEVLVESPILPADARDENGVNSEMPIENTQEESVCPETQLSSEIQDNDQEKQPDLTETSPESSQACCLNAPPPELMDCEEPISSLDVECPMCGCSFSQTQIERHAAYCDGTKDEPQMTVLRPRNRQSKHMYNGSHDSVASSDSGRLEKCYLCKSLVPIKDYQTHVDKCLQSAAQETQGTQMLKGSKETTEREGRLLNMLEQSESISADENNSALDFSGMSPPREEHAGSFGSSHLSINDSPIRSFVSISEAKDCLVDFKKQLSRPKYQPSKKRPQHRGKRRRMCIFKPGTKCTCLFVGNYMMMWKWKSHQNFLFYTT